MRKDRFTDEALRNAMALAELKYSESAEDQVAFEEAYDFARCQRPDGSFYGTSGQCRKGKESGAKEAPAKKARPPKGSPAEKAKAWADKQVAKDKKPTPAEKAKAWADKQVANEARKMAQKAERDEQNAARAKRGAPSPAVAKAINEARKMAQKAERDEQNAARAKRGKPSPEAAKAIKEARAMVKKALLDEAKNARNFSEAYDFTTCARPDGSKYGTGGQCRKGKETTPGSKEEAKGGGAAAGGGANAAKIAKYDKKISGLESKVKTMESNPDGWRPEAITKAKSDLAKAKRLREKAANEDKNAAAGKRKDEVDPRRPGPNSIRMAKMVKEGVGEVRAALKEMDKHPPLSDAWNQAGFKLNTARNRLKNITSMVRDTKSQLETRAKNARREDKKAADQKEIERLNRLLQTRALKNR